MNEAQLKESLDHPKFDPMTFHTAPNYLTLLRVIFVPGVVYALYQKTPGFDLLAGILFGLASITDYFDGYLARKLKIETIYGKLLDPLADKFLVICSLIMLQEIGRLSAVIVMILVCRELTITGLRALASAEGVIVAASQGGKWKTAIQMVAIPFVMVRDALFGIPLFDLGIALTYLSLLLSLWSAKDYIVGFFKGLAIATKKRAERRRRRKEEKAKKEMKKI